MWILADVLLGGGRYFFVCTLLYLTLGTFTCVDLFAACRHRGFTQGCF